MNKIFKPLGASNHVAEDRQEHDYYATDPRAVELLLGVEQFHRYIWEPACGEGHISKALEAAGHKVWSTDLIYRGYGEKYHLDFLAKEFPKFFGDIITNPPYTNALEFVEKAIETVEEGRKVAMFLKLLFLESKGRKEFFKKHPPRTIYVFSSRIACAKNGDFEKYKNAAVCFAWFVWEKGYKGETVVKWIN